MPRIRSISDVVKYFKDKDPETQLTETTIRRLIADGQIPVVRVGVKYLINLDLLEDMFCNKDNIIPKYGPDFVVNK